MSADVPEPEPFLAELAEEDGAFVAELVEPHERVPRRRRPARRAPEPAPPHPGFWWAILWCGVMYIVAQIFPAVAVVVVMVIAAGIRAGSADAAMKWLLRMQENQEYLLPVMSVVELSMIVTGFVVLRIVVGWDWARQVALRLPAVTHTVLAVVAWPALTVTASGIYLVVKAVMPGFPQLPDYFVTLCALLGVIGVLWGAVRLATGRDWTQVLARQEPAIQLAVTTVYCLGFLGLGAVIFRLLRPYLPALDFLPEGSMEDAVKEFRNWPPTVGVLVIGLGPGLGEELWCRAFFGRGLVGRHGVVMGVVLTSFFFGAIHIDPHQGTMAALMGLALHFSYLMTRSLWIPMLLHTLNNSLSVIADKLPGDTGERLKNIDTSPEALPRLGFAAAVALLAAVGWALYSSRGRLVRVDGADEPPWQPPFPGVAHPPPGSGTAVVYPWPGLLPTLAVVAGAAAFVCAVYWG